eukprot:SAG11_NODE_2634_length_3150_cov_44.903966_3_plen_177_part_00
MRGWRAASVVVANNSFTNSRASGIILQTHNAVIEGNTIANVSSHGISVGNYYNAFSESPFGSGLAIRQNSISRPGLSHKTVTGGQWGGGGAVSVSGSPKAPNATALHRNISLLSNTIAPLQGQPAVAVQATTGLLVAHNHLCTFTTPNRIFHCEGVRSRDNICCDEQCEQCHPCTK